MDQKQLSKELCDGGIRVNWFRVIVDLCTLHAYTHSLIAMAVGAPKSTVQGWKQGATPKWEDGERLVCLWSQVTGKGREELPRVSAFDWRR